ncbi:SMI1/KNR4 family protein [Cognatilysobacter bugurensis]|uniref:Knr4/Smi1-like domain-containing protein n=1 Tax=Cognatilysobacter bugurensis TaxID=543356 RepID=A0A918SUV0_9GAMM|nr:SMI1/KNR4 family protein [Lysobacter bugurensis]GHA70174.1 hypothetical protein GCM10007067_02810 [Lysobacter bugurensis]
MYEQLQEKISSTDVIRWHPGQEVEDEWIADAEQELGVRLPPSYKWWLKTFGSGAVGGSEILTLAPPEFRDDADADLVYIHRLNRANPNWPEGRIFILQTSPEEVFYFDLGDVSANGEYAVFREDVFGAKPERYADSFSQFLERLIDEYA